MTGRRLQPGGDQNQCERLRYTSYWWSCDSHHTFTNYTAQLRLMERNMNVLIIMTVHPMVERFQSGSQWRPDTTTDRRYHPRSNAACTQTHLVNPLLGASSSRTARYKWNVITFTQSKSAVWLRFLHQTVICYFHQLTAAKTLLLRPCCQQGALCLAQTGNWSWQTVT